MRRAIFALIAAVCTFFCSINLLDPESILFLKSFMYVFLGFTNYKSKYLHSSQCIGCMHAVVVQLGDYSAMPEKDLYIHMVTDVPEIDLRAFS